MLSLTDTQQTQVKALLTEQKQKFDAMPQETSAQETSGDPTAIHEKMRAIRDETNSRISALLNDDQKAKFAAWEERQKSMMGRRQRGNGDQPPPPPPDGGGSPPGL
jgi:hypothetical protein